MNFALVLGAVYHLCASCPEQGARGMRFGELRASLWLSVARCVARSEMVVAGKFASILICGLDSSCVTHSRNLFCGLAFLVLFGPVFMHSDTLGYIRMLSAKKNCEKKLKNFGEKNGQQFSRFFEVFA